LPEEAGIGAAPPVRASLASVAKRSAPADLADELGGGKGAATALCKQLRGVAFNQRRELRLELADAGSVRCDLAHELACDPHTRGLLGAGETAGDFPESLGGV